MFVRHRDITKIDTIIIHTKDTQHTQKKERPSFPGEPRRTILKRIVVVATVTDEAVTEAFGDGKPKKSISSSSHSIYDVSGFNSITSSIASPALKQPYHLTAAKVKQSELLVDYEPLPPVSTAPYNNMTAPATSKKRAHGEIGGDEDLMDEDEEDDDDDTLVV